MSRNADSLVLASFLTSGLGFLFWVVAARLYPAASVGVGAALVSAMGFVANAATLGLRNGLVRFLPISGSGARQLIRRSYLLCGGTSLLLGLGFLVGQPLWGGDLAPGRWGAAMFLVATVAWVVFVLQDSVLTGLREATWVPVKNAVYAMAKLALLFALVAVPDWSVLLAWFLPALLLVLPFHWLTTRRLLPRRASAGAESVHVKDLVRFAAGDHLAMFLGLAQTNLLPLLVLEVRGPAESAYYFLAMTVADSLFVVTSSISSAFLAEAAMEPDRIPVLLRRAIRHAAVLVLPVVGGGVLLAAPLLHVLGPDYAANGTTLLQFLLLGAVPQVLVGMALGLARLHKRMHVVVMVYGFPTVVLFTAAVLGLDRWGLAVIGYANLAVQLVLVVALAPSLVQALSRPGRHRRH